MAPTIIQSTTLTAASGIESRDTELQAGGATAGNSVVGGPSVSGANSLGAIAGISSSSSIQKQQGVGSLAHLLLAKGIGQSGLIFSNVLQNPSFELGLGRWTLSAGPGDNIFPVFTQPLGVGFNDSSPVLPPNGTRMVHFSKGSPSGVLILSQNLNLSPNSTAGLGQFSFQICADTPLRTQIPGTQDGRYLHVVLEFYELGVLQYRLAYSFTVNQLPADFPASLLPFSRRIDLSYDTEDVFVRFSRDLGSDVDQTFSFDNIKLWFVQAQTNDLAQDTFDLLLDDISLSLLLNQDALEATSGEDRLIIFSPDLSRGAVLFSVLGTEKTVEKFFDRSPFFFGSHESDPNTLRDLSEAQQFLLFSSTEVLSFKQIGNTSGSAIVVSTKGDVVSSSFQEISDLLSNGGFELGLSNWTVIDSDPSDTISAVASIPAQGGLGPLDPLEGALALYTVAADVGAARDPIVIQQKRKLFRKFSSSLLRNFEFSVAVNGSTPDEQNLVVLRFLEAGEERFNLQYMINNRVPDPLPPEIADFDRRLNISVPINQWTTAVRTLSLDTQRASFNFDEIELSILVDTAAGNATYTAWDKFSLGINFVDLGLLSTSSPAHISTGHPTASGFPFTISGSDDISQIDLLPPFFDETVPASGTSFNPPDPQLSFHIKDISTPIDSSSINVWIKLDTGEVVQVVANGSPQTSATYPSVVRQDLGSTDIQYTVTRATEFPQQAIVTVSGSFADLATPANEQTQEYSFKLLGSGTLNATIVAAADADPPVIAPTFPVNGQTQVSPNTAVSWSTTDNAAGVDPVSLALKLNGQLALSGDIGQLGTFTRTANANRGFDYVFQPFVPFKFGETVTGTITVADLASPPNTANLTYSWSITPDDTLFITNFFLQEGSSAVLTSGTLAHVEVEDLVHGIDLTATSLQVNGSIPPGLITVTSGVGPNRVIFEFPVQPLVDFRSDLNILVHAENKFPGPVPVIKEETFILRPGYLVQWFNKNLDSSLPGPEVVFPFVSEIPVLVEASNFAKNSKVGSGFFKFITENIANANLGAFIEANIKTADLPGNLAVLSPHFEYGKTMTLEVEVKDLEGNAFTFVHVFTIEDKPK